MLRSVEISASFPNILFETEVKATKHYTSDLKLLTSSGKTLYQLIVRSMINFSKRTLMHKTDL
jgi:hypothetical protein